MKHVAKSVLAATLLASATLAGAQVTPISRTIPVTFTGTVVDDVANTIRIRQADGSFTNYTGPVPDYPYKKGDTVTVSFNATVPTAAAFEAGQPYSGRLSADGTFKFSVSSPYYNGGTAPGGVGNSTTVDVSGPIKATANSGQPTNQRVDLVYNANTDSYYVDFSTRNFVAGTIDGPGFSYDPGTGALASRDTSCERGPSGCASTGDGGFSLTGNATQVGTGNIPIYGGPTDANPSGGGLYGFLSMLFSGAWNLPTWNGGAVDVPEPGSMLLFGGAAAALLSRRRKAKANLTPLNPRAPSASGANGRGFH